MNIIKQIAEGLPLAERPNETERELASMEQAWGDCAHGLRTGLRFSLKPDVDTLHTQPLLEVHEYLDVYRLKYEAGDKSAILWAIRECARQNLPLPYWCATGYLQAIHELERTPTTLGQVFGTEESHKGGKAGAIHRRNREQAIRLLVCVRQIHKRHPKLSKDACIRRAIDELGLHVSQRKATDLFNNLEAEQKPYRKALRMNWSKI
ncbi:MAG: hypothetical protein RBT42_08335 [Aquabacterium sp.]|jgi:hypothetical protein|uniref:hypothetical protein n=1 Tax=Aquabacterium sp. TaxID=1872578 RepID=UPI002A36752C|nr:hypothetical protein [Aquabacterium sp.]MDX9843751.1 hypothetical protein [Aquabacterium sp.]